MCPGPLFLSCFVSFLTLSFVWILQENPHLCLFFLNLTHQFFFVSLLSSLNSNNLHSTSTFDTFNCFNIVLYFIFFYSKKITRNRCTYLVMFAQVDSILSFFFMASLYFQFLVVKMPSTHRRLFTLTMLSKYHLRAYRKMLV